MRAALFLAHTLSKSETCVTGEKEDYCRVLLKVGSPNYAITVSFRMYLFKNVQCLFFLTFLNRYPKFLKKRATKKINADV